MLELIDRSRVLQRMVWAVIRVALIFSMGYLAQAVR